MSKKLPLTYNSRDLNDLIPEFRIKVEKMIANIAERGITVIPYSTVRSPLVQAENYVKGRTDAQLRAIIENLRNLGCENLRTVMQYAFMKRAKTSARLKIVTNALPGQSWHMWGEAVDCYVENPENKKKPDWEHPTGYKIMQEEAEALGLTSGGSFKRLVEPVHTQFRPGSPPSSWYQFDQTLGRKFDFSSLTSVGKK